MPPEMGPKSRNGSDWDFWLHTREYNAIAFLALSHGARGLVRITTLIMNNHTSKTITTAIKMPSMLIIRGRCVNSFVQAEHVFDGIQNGRVGVFVAI
jgi:hypothetical protein